MRHLLLMTRGFRAKRTDVLWDYLAPGRWGDPDVSAAFILGHIGRTEPTSAFAISEGGSVLHRALTRRDPTSLARVVFWSTRAVTCPIAELIPAARVVHDPLDAIVPYDQRPRPPGAIQTSHDRGHDLPVSGSGLEAAFGWVIE